MRPSQSSYFKVIYMSNYQLLSLNTLYIVFYEQNREEIVIFNGIARSTIKICQRDLIKVSVLKYSLKEPINSSFTKALYA